MGNGRDMEDYRAAVIAESMEVEGWMSEEALGWLYARAGELRLGSVWVEVGVYAGRSFFTVLQGLDEGCYLVGVDDFSGVRGALSGSALSQSFWSRAAKYPQRDFLFYPLRSVDAAGEFENGAVDVVFIDGSHDYEEVRSDILAWLPKLRRGGLLCGHDISDKRVERAVSEILPGWKKEPGDIWSSRCE